MSCSQSKIIGPGFACAAVLGAWLLALPAIAAEEQPKEPVAEAAPDVDPAPTDAPGYWLGVACVAQIDAPGVSLMHVVPDSPADQAGLQPGDILLQLGDQQLNTVRDLVDAVAGLQGNKATLQYSRQGEPQKVEMQPVQRPAQADLPGLDHARMETWRRARELANNFAGPNQGRRLFLHPGMMLPPPAVFGALPEGVEIRIEGRGQEPARIVITDGDKTYETTADKLHELPPAASQLFFGQPALPLTDDALPAPELRFHRFRWSPPPGPSDEAVDELREQVEALRSAVEKLQQPPSPKND
ncbi:PDZ domain-containing protein [Lignipirellula cremea]|uniref:Zinc metalloprotease n=1 Tax=Lignipirellula cremea TaxID=2528010 RepID=A0A518DP08_9BACT|nr:PDZ domain-containing protein [Lignipirellula cremea]QDU93566.1 Putative zinc metalloprotease [Lignipirellula cremea]